jgi:DNA helicase IV
VPVERWDHSKGLEADAIVIVDDRSDDDAETHMTRYVARSRGKHVLVVIQVHLD